MFEQRREYRARVYLASETAFYNRIFTVSCLVKNMSDAGAKLVFAHPVILPETFDLSIKKEARRRSARIVWRTATEVGIAFAAA